MSHLVFAVKLEEGITKKHPGVKYTEKGHKLVKAAKDFFSIQEDNVEPQCC